MRADCLSYHLLAENCSYSHVQTRGTQHKSVVESEYKATVTCPGQFIALQTFNVLKETFTGYDTSVVSMPTAFTTSFETWHELCVHVHSYTQMRFIFVALKAFEGRLAYVTIFLHMFSYHCI